MPVWFAEVSAISFLRCRTDQRVRSTLTSGREWKTDRATPAAAARSPIGTDSAVQPAATSPDTASTGQDSSRVIDIPAFLRRQEVDETEEA